MKKLLVKLLILGALALSTTAAFPLEAARFDGGAPFPCGIAPFPACPQGTIR